MLGYVESLCTSINKLRQTTTPERHWYIYFINNRNIIRIYTNSSITMNITQTDVSNSGYDRTWLGIYRPQNSNILQDLRYYSDGTNITYHNWYPADPNNRRNREDCVAIIPRVSFQ